MLQDVCGMINLQSLGVNSKADFVVDQKQPRDLKLKIHSSKLMEKRKKVWKQSLISSKPRAAEQVL